MAGKVFLFVGPRKTGTTSLYEDLRFVSMVIEGKESFY